MREFMTKSEIIIFLGSAVENSVAIWDYNSIIGRCGRIRDTNEELYYHTWADGHEREKWHNLDRKQFTLCLLDSESRNFRYRKVVNDGVVISCPRESDIVLYWIDKTKQMTEVMKDSASTDGKLYFDLWELRQNGVLEISINGMVNVI